MGEQQIERRVRAPAGPEADRRAIRAPAGDKFRSILFETEEPDVTGTEEPLFFHDLNLDQVVAANVQGRDEYNLVPFFHLPLRSAAAVEYRHEVFRDLEQDAVRDVLQAFAERMRSVRRRLGLAKKQHYRVEKQRWFLDAAATYCDAISSLTRG